jgi:hypothetical protein
MCALMVFVSCKQKNQYPYAYNLNRDTIPPDLRMTVPVNMDTYSYGEDIHIVGTLTDLESRNSSTLKAGKLKSLYLNVSIVDGVMDTVQKVIFQKWLNVDSKEGYTINEKTIVTGGGGPVKCKFRGIAVDYADHADSTVLYFTVN